MPYIKDRWYRWELEDPLSFPKGPGELNYILTMIINEYWKANESYQTINDVIGALEGAKLEFYRRIAAPYENGKVKENGDVYG